VAQLFSLGIKIGFSFELVRLLGKISAVRKEEAVRVFVSEPVTFSASGLLFAPHPTPRAGAAAFLDQKWEAQIRSV
jgi:hypothetical protein